MPRETGEGSPEERESQAKAAFYDLLRKNNSFDADELATGKNLGGNELWTSPEAKKAALEGIVYGLKLMRSGAIREIVQRCEISEEQLRTPELQAQALEAMANAVKGGSVGTFRAFKELFGISDEASHAPDMVAGAMSAMKLLQEKHADGRLSAASLEQSTSALEREFGISRTDSSNG